MKKVVKFINDNGTIIILCVSLLLLMRTCSINTNIEKKNKNIESRLDSINNRIELLKTELDLKIEIGGLKSGLMVIDIISDSLANKDRTKTEMKYHKELVEKEKVNEMKLKTLENKLKK